MPTGDIQAGNNDTKLENGRIETHSNNTPVVSANLHTTIPKFLNEYKERFTQYHMALKVVLMREGIDKTMCEIKKQLDTFEERLNEIVIKMKKCTPEQAPQILDELKNLENSDTLKHAQGRIYTYINKPKEERDPLILQNYDFVFIEFRRDLKKLVEEIDDVYDAIE